MMGEGYITISWQEETGLKSTIRQFAVPGDPEKIRQHDGIKGLSQMVEIQVVDGKVELVTPYPCWKA